MRQIAILPPDHAERFQDYLIARGIKCSLDSVADGSALWIMDEDRLDEAKTELAAFQAAPADPKYQAARQQANEVLKAEAAKRAAARKNIRRGSQLWQSRGPADCPLTVGMMLICIYLFVETWLMGHAQEYQAQLFISRDGTWTAIREGEWWRLLTPMLLHAGPMHILFNLMMWWDFGLQIEMRKGTLRFLLLVIAVSITANVLQFTMVGHRFLGLSGVVFGQFGYLWMKGQLDPEDGLGVTRSQVQWTLVWYLLCFAGVIGNIANWAHAGGLLAGMLLGCASALWRRVR